jgi:hypothetical protein
VKGIAAEKRCEHSDDDNLTEHFLDGFLKNLLYYDHNENMIN